jgi:thioredoxin 1
MKMKKFILALIICFCLFFTLAIEVNAQVKVGSARQDVIDAFGEPSGVMTSGEEEILSYPGGMVVILDGKVSQIDDNFSNRIKQRKQEQAYDAKQQEKGLIQHLGQWITPSEKKQIDDNKKLRNPIMVYSNGGQEIQLGEILVKDKITIVDFYADWCGPCKRLSPYLEKLARSDQDIYLRKVNIVKWGTPVTKQFSINSVPDVRVFDRRGRMVGRPTYSFNEILSYVQRAK